MILILPSAYHFTLKTVTEFLHKTPPKHGNGFLKPNYLTCNVKRSVPDYIYGPHTKDKACVNTNDFQVCLDWWTCSEDMTSPETHDNSVSIK
jgi:hypothetical protein